MEPGARVPAIYHQMSGFLLCQKKKKKKKKKKKAVATETFPCTERTSKARKVRAVMFIKIVPTLNRDLPQALFTPESQELPSP